MTHAERITAVNNYFSYRGINGVNPLPTKPLLIDPATTVIKPYLTVEFNLATVNEHAKDLGAYETYLDQLEKIMEYLVKNNL